MLPIDRAERDLFLSLGAAAECAVLAGAEAGATLRFVPEVDGARRLAGHLEPVPGRPLPDDLRLAVSLPDRATGRKRHLPVALPSILITAMRRETIGWRSRLYTTTDRAVIGRLASVLRVATRRDLGDSGTARARAAWLRLDPRHPAFGRDGLTAAELGLRGPAGATVRLTRSPTLSPLLGRLGLGLVAGLHAQRLIRRSTAMALLTAPSYEPEDLLATGRLLVRLELLATEVGFSIHIVNAPLRYDNLARRVAEQFDIPGGVPAVLFRLGMTPLVPRSGRLPPEDLLLKPGAVP